MKDLYELILEYSNALYSFSVFRDTALLYDGIQREIESPIDMRAAITIAIEWAIPNIIVDTRPANSDNANPFK